MSRTVFVVVAAIALGGLASYLAVASGHVDGEAAPIFGIKIFPGLEADLRGPRSGESKRYSGSLGQ